MSGSIVKETKVATKSSSATSKMEIKSIDDFPSTSLSCLDSSSSIWNEIIEFPALRVPVHATAKIRHQLKSMLWRHARGGAGGRPNIYPDPQQPKEFRILILQIANPANSHGETKEEEESSQQQQQEQQQRTIQQILEQNNEKDILDDIQQTTYTLDFTYDDYTVEQAMRKILPVELHAEIPCSFESVGPIAHVNLREAYEPFKFWIGKILLDKNQPRIQTVVTKIGTIDNEYRTFDMQIIAQRKSNTSNSSNNNKNDNNDWSIVTVKEEKCTFTLDFQKVYWNSRLAGEHRRLVQEIQKHAAAKRQRQRQGVGLQSTVEQQQQQAADTLVVADLMAGVGPFAIPLTAPPASKVPKKKNSKKNKSHENHQHQQQPNVAGNIRVYANDLNPDSYKYLKINAQQNKCRDLICSNQDARAILAELQKEQVVIDHVIMNLPASAPEFLDMFRGYNSTNTSSPQALSSIDEPSSLAPQEQPKQPTAYSSTLSSHLPKIHVYCFAPKPMSQLQEEQTEEACTQNDDKCTSDHDDPTSSGSKSGAASSTTVNENAHDYQESLDRCARALGIDSLDRERDDVHIHVVRDVSPQKNMICISFQLPFSVTTLPRVPFQRLAAVDSKSTEKDANDSISGSHGLQADDDDDDDKRKRGLESNAKTTCTESKAEIDPNKRSKGTPIN